MVPYCVSIITEVFGWFVRMCFRSSMPPNSGTLRSVTTMSTGDCSNISSASSVVAAVRTSRPISEAMSRHSCRVASSSSTIRMDTPTALALKLAGLGSISTITFQNVHDQCQNEAEKSLKENRLPTTRSEDVYRRGTGVNQLTATPPHKLRRVWELQKRERPKFQCGNLRSRMATC